MPFMDFFPVGGAITHLKVYWIS